MHRRVSPGPLLELDRVCVDFTLRKGLFARKLALRAVEGVSLALTGGETLAVVGESGSGKTTLGRAVIGDLHPTRGRVVINGVSLGSLSRKGRARIAQPVAQDPSAALDPRWTIRRLLREPFRIHKELASDPAAAIDDILEATRLPKALLERFPHELSGGQLQRVAIARALLLRPKLLVCDEAVSALDAAVQAEIVELLKSIQQEFGTAILFITHDLHLVPRIADRIAVMYLGRLVEIGRADRIGGSASHPYTQALYGAAPRIGRRTGKRATLQGEPPSPVDRPAGCAFHPRCPYAVDRCASVPPEPVSPGGSVFVSCHLAEEAPAVRDDIREMAQ